MADPRILLAHTAHGAIFACQCGAIHITVGEIAFSVSLEEFVIPERVSGFLEIADLSEDNLAIFGCVGTVQVISRFL